MIGETVSHYAPEVHACPSGWHPLNKSIYDPVGSHRPAADKVLEKLGEARLNDRLKNVERMHCNW
jgi:hypothetical protein